MLRWIFVDDNHEAVTHNSITRSCELCIFDKTIYDAFMRGDGPFLIRADVEIDNGTGKMAIVKYIQIENKVQHFSRFISYCYAEMLKLEKEIVIMDDMDSISTNDKIYNMYQTIKKSKRSKKGLYHCAWRSYCALISLINYRYRDNKIMFIFKKYMVKRMINKMFSGDFIC